MREVSAGAAEFLDVMTITDDGAGTFAGKSMSRPGNRVFGGQLLGQSVLAAGRTVPGDRHVHSLHAFFLHPGNPAETLRYSVHRVRDGANFSARQVTGSQGDRVIVTVTASFQRAGGEGLTHQVPMTPVPGPEGLEPQFPFVLPGAPAETQAVELRRVFDDAELPGPEDENSLAGVANGHPGPARSDVRQFGEGRADAAVWMRFTHELPDDPLLHAAALAYLSDYSILRGALRMHSIRRGSVRTASLDHSMWFHRPPRLEGWTLYDIFSPAANGLRALGTGRLYTQSGTLMASVAQEGLVRLSAGPADPK
ncbi:MAG TPA: acyl-CoA thioesterase domain-containing protein [Trebonia sp.]